MTKAERDRKKSAEWYARNRALVSKRRKKRYATRQVLDEKPVYTGFDMPPLREGLKAYRHDFSAQDSAALNACCKRRGLLAIRTWRGWKLAA